MKKKIFVLDHEISTEKAVGGDDFVKFSLKLNFRNKLIK